MPQATPAKRSRRRALAEAGTPQTTPGREDGGQVTPGAPLRIAMLVPPWFELPPPGYGGLEQVCAALVDCLAERGHDITLFGAGERTGTKATFVSTDPTPQFERMNQSLPELAHIARVDRLLAEGDFDIVHDHISLGPLAALRRRAPTVVTVHNCPIGETGDYLACVDHSVSLVAISGAQRRLREDLNWAATVHNGIVVPGPGKAEASTGPVLWLARFHPDKGPDLAIKACREAGLPLVLAGKCKFDDEWQYLRDVIAPMLGPDVELILNGNRQTTDRLLAEARCLLMPIRWEEPFGMVFVEAMAAGTPVVATRHGAVPEIVDHGRTGFICEVEELPRALHDVVDIDPAACVEHVRTSFSADLMAQRYEAVYRRCMARELGRRPTINRVLRLGAQR